MVLSVVVDPLTDAPTSWSGSKKLLLWFFEPSNITCSNRWANPVRPASSSFDPT